MARAAAAEVGVADRATFRLAEGETLTEHEAFDVAFAFEALHDMPRPVEVLAAMRRSIRPGGQVVIVDEAVDDELMAPASPVDQLMYGFSMFVCLPDGLSSEPSAGTGTAVRPDPGGLFPAGRVPGRERVPIEDFAFFRFYRLEA